MYHSPVCSTRIPVAVKRSMPPGSSYLGEDEMYYYWMEPAATDQLGGFFDNIGGMFKRMVKFTPKSFTPGSIYEGFINTTLTAATGGIYQVLPKHLKKTVYKVGRVAVPVVAGGVLAATMGPSIMSMLVPKLTAAGKLLSSGASTLFRAKGGEQYGPNLPTEKGGEQYGPNLPTESLPGVMADGGTIEQALAIGGEVMNLLGRLPQNKQAEVVQRLTPEDLAYMERYQQIPPHLKKYFDSMAQSTFNPPVAGSGADSLYEAYGPQPAHAPVEAGVFGKMEPMTLALLVGVPALFWLFTKK